MAKMKFKAMKTEMWGVFRVGTMHSPFRMLEAAFNDYKTAAVWEAMYKKSHFSCATMVEKIKATVPAWDGTVPSQSIL